MDLFVLTSKLYKMSSIGYSRTVPKMLRVGSPDDTDGSGNVTSSKASAAIAHLNAKIERTKDLIRLEQTIRDGWYFHRWSILTSIS